MGDYEVEEVEDFRMMTADGRNSGYQPYESESKNFATLDKAFRPSSQIRRFERRLKKRRDKKKHGKKHHHYDDDDCDEYESHHHSPHHHSPHHQSPHHHSPHHHSPHHHSPHHRSPHHQSPVKIHPTPIQETVMPGHHLHRLPAHLSTADCPVKVQPDGSIIIPAGSHPRQPHMALAGPLPGSLPSGAEPYTLGEDVQYVWDNANQSTRSATGLSFVKLIFVIIIIILVIAGIYWVMKNNREKKQVLESSSFEASGLGPDVWQRVRHDIGYDKSYHNFG